MDCEALLNHNSELEDRLAAPDAEDGSSVPHEVAVAIIRGKSPILAFRTPRSYSEAVAHRTIISV